MDEWRSFPLQSRVTDCGSPAYFKCYLCMCVLWWCMVCVVRLFVLVSSFRVYLPLGRVGFNKVCVCMCVIGGDW